MKYISDKLVISKKFQMVYYEVKRLKAHAKIMAVLYCMVFPLIGLTVNIDKTTVQRWLWLVCIPLLIGGWAVLKESEYEFTYTSSTTTTAFPDNVYEETKYYSKHKNVGLVCAWFTVAVLLSGLVRWTLEVYLAAVTKRYRMLVFFAQFNKRAYWAGILTMMIFGPIACWSASDYITPNSKSMTNTPIVWLLPSIFVVVVSGFYRMMNSSMQNRKPQARRLRVPAV